MRILIVSPEAPQSTLGNSITAARWSRILCSLDHHVSIATGWQGETFDLLIALHAQRSHASVEQFRRECPQKPIVVALTGTDLYRDLRKNAEARHSLSTATRVIALQEAALAELDDETRAKTRVIYQSAAPPDRHEPPREDAFEVCVLSHLRDVKDPLRTALASRRLPGQSRIRVLHAGSVLEPKWEDAARAEQRANPRYIWIGVQSHESALQLLARCRLLVLSSFMEGGANAISEAVVCGVPVLCSHISGNVGMLGDGYPGYFEPGATEELAGLLYRAETDQDFFRSLKRFVEKLKLRFSPDEELLCWDSLLYETFNER